MSPLNADALNFKFGKQDLTMKEWSKVEQKISQTDKSQDIRTTALNSLREPSGPSQSTSVQPSTGTTQKEAAALVLQAVTSVKAERSQLKTSLQEVQKFLQNSTQQAQKKNPGNFNVTTQPFWDDKTQSIKYGIDSMEKDGQSFFYLAGKDHKSAESAAEEMCFDMTLYEMRVDGTFDMQFPNLGIEPISWDINQNSITLTIEPSVVHPSLAGDVSIELKFSDFYDINSGDWDWNKFTQGLQKEIDAMHAGVETAVKKTQPTTRSMSRLIPQGEEHTQSSFALKNFKVE